MQFHLNGFQTGDPDMAPSVGDTQAPGNTLPAEVDVLIVGCGPAGLTLAAQLCAFPEIRVAIIDQKPGPLQLGQADGIACRTMEMFNAFGFAEKVEREAYWVNETSFWKPDPERSEAIARSGRVDDVEDGLSEFPHVILNQARVHDFYLGIMKNAPRRLEPFYGRRLTGLEAEGTGPVTVRLKRLEGDEVVGTETVRARYVVGCDGARSNVRRALGLELRGEAANQAWGVMDVLARTDFPDIRLKALVQSAGEGSILIIPREGGYLVRIYVELDKLNPDERVASRNLTVDHLIRAAQRILAPYTLDVREVAWWSVYEIGQRICDRFDDAQAGSTSGSASGSAGARTPRVFIAGDACHTHSPKAGQGMNVSMQDAFNLGWKLAHVLTGRSAPELLSTYSAERQAIAQDLIDFDRAWAAMLSAPLRSETNPDGVDPAEVQRTFVAQGRYTAGTASRYSKSDLTGAGAHQALAQGFPVGMRFHSAPVIRLGDARPMHLGHAITADGRWRLFAFADRADPASDDAALSRLCRFLAADPASPVLRHTAEGADIDAVIDVRAVLQQPHRDLALDTMPPFLLPQKGRYGLTDYEKMFCPDPRHNIFDLRGIDRDRGAVVIVRPDQYVADVLPLDAHGALSAFFNGVLLRRR